MVAIHKAKGFDIILTDSAILVKTNLQVSLLYCDHYGYQCYIDQIRDHLPEIKTFNDLFGFFYHPRTHELIIKTRGVKEQWYL
jgi:hypothetical protein